MDSGEWTPRITQPVRFWVLRDWVRVRKSIARAVASLMLLVSVVVVAVVVASLFVNDDVAAFSVAVGG